MRRFFIALFSLLCIGLLIIIAINIKDETLNPEIPPLFAWDVSPINNNSYVFLLGFMAPVHQDPLELGVLRITSSGNHTDDPGLGPSAFVDLTGLLCDGDDDCYPGYGSKRQSLEQLIRENQLWLQRYQQLLRYTEFQELLKPSHAMRIIPPAVLQSQRLLLAQIALDPVGMRDLLQQDIRFWRMVLGQETGLVSKMIAVRANKSAYGLLQFVLAEYPELRESFHQELLPLTNIEKSLKSSLNNEFLAMAQTLLALENLQDTGYEFYFWVHLLTLGQEMFFYQKNATVNQLYNFHSSYLQVVDQGREKQNEIYQEEIEDITKTWPAIYNPFGKFLLSIAIVNYDTFQQRIVRLDQQIQKTRATD